MPSTSHSAGKFYNPVRSRRSLRDKRVPPGRGAGGVRGARAGVSVAPGSVRGRGRGR